MEFLNEVEKELVARFHEDGPMREAVKKVLLDALYHSGVLEPGKPADPLHNAAFMAIHRQPNASNEHIGEVNRAMYEGLLAIEAGFDKMSQCSKVEAKPAKPNKAR